MVWQNVTLRHLTIRMCLVVTSDSQGILHGFIHTCSALNVFVTTVASVMSVIAVRIIPWLPERRRKSFSVEDKIRIIRMIESGRSMADVSREVGLSSSTVSTIWKVRDCVKSAYEKNMLGSRRLQKPSVRNDVEHALFRWYAMKRAANKDVSMSVLQQKAEEFANLLGGNCFFVTYRWLERFKARYNIH